MLYKSQLKGLNMKILLFFTLNILLTPSIFASDLRRLEIYSKVAAMLRTEKNGYGLYTSTIERITNRECLPNTLHCSELAWQVKCKYLDLNHDIPVEEFSNYCFSYFTPDEAQSLIDQASIMHETQRAKIFNFLTTGICERLQREPFQYCTSYSLTHLSLGCFQSQLKFSESYSITCSDDYPIQEEFGKQYRIRNRFETVEEIIVRHKPKETAPQVRPRSPSEDEDWILCKLPEKE